MLAYRSAKQAPGYRVAPKDKGFEVVQCGDYCLFFSQTESVTLSQGEILSGKIWLRSRLEKTNNLLDPGSQVLCPIIQIQRIPASGRQPLRPAFAERAEASGSQALQTWLFSLLVEICEEMEFHDWISCKKTFELLNMLDSHLVWIDHDLRRFKQHRENLLLPYSNKLLPPPGS